MEGWIVIKRICHIYKRPYRYLIHSCDLTISVSFKSHSGSIIQKQRSCFIPNKVSGVLINKNICRSFRITPKVPNFHKSLIYSFIRKFKSSKFNFSSWVRIYIDVVTCSAVEVPTNIHTLTITRCWALKSIDN